jgi:hypothetical protein
MGTVPADSISQLVNVLRPNWVDLAVKRSKLRLCHRAIKDWLDDGTDVNPTFDGIAATSNLK